MSNVYRFDRRSFLKQAGIAAVAGSLGTATSIQAQENGASRSSGSGYNFDEIYNRIGTDCSKWDGQIERWGEQLKIPMGVADMDFRVAPAITEALKKRIDHEVYGYMAVPDSYRDSIVNWNERRYGTVIERDMLQSSPALLPGLLAALRAFNPPGAKVVMQTPGYNGFFSTIRKGFVIEENPLREVNGVYEMDFDDLDRKLAQDDVHTFILCNPHNPVGNCWDRATLTELGELCARHNVIVLADEIHCDFVNAGQEYVPYANLADDLVMNSVTFKSASKSFNLAAFKDAYMFSHNPEFMSRIRAVGDNATVNSLGMIGSQAALEDGDDWMDALQVYLSDNAAYASAFINEQIPHMSCNRPEGTYLAWLNVEPLIERIGAVETAAAETTARGPDQDEVTPEMIAERYLIETSGVKLNPGSAYWGSGRMRMNLGLARPLLEEALGRIQGAMQQA
ncbi:MAG: aminotransferase class I/II-fold pyridoxal phosphate-dependent enzyme [Gammaproteobacteria bacterium]|nr:aminotransferase class I/II-fold pyridoxal phosphate-dependent enzyme [Gammaproteobacteria bacterium]MYE28254.1 aminotransferase class I/II-fold pyridoxal phosphate-dependent enzyme [Gammaproteobacteria bacterium]MYI03208.1 aminotransferase class I/II-fold pyridoxal phosphate-dependent enzyme [Gammaproteobacteria bacterium]